MIKYYKVGGAIRDKLLNHPVKDTDWVVVGATVDDMLQRGFRPVGKDFPVFLHPETQEEYALARTERKTGTGYTGFTVHAAPDVTLEQDLQRRDLTINAMAQMAETGEIIDPFGGQADLQAKILRHVSPAFIEDPVRLLRIARFAARYNFEIAEETQQLMQTMVINGEVDNLVAERVWAETAKALTEPYPEVFIKILRQCGALARIFPELDALFGVPQTASYHPEVDTGIHLLLALQQARRLTVDPQIIFAVLMHDLGKALTSKEILPHHYGHEESGVPLVERFCQRLKVPTQWKELAVLVTRYHLHCHRFAELNYKTKLELFQKLDAFRRPQRIEQFLTACQADAQGRLGYENVSYPSIAQFKQAFSLTQAVTVQTFVQQGIQGAAIGEAVRRERLRILRENGF